MTQTDKILLGVLITTLVFYLLVFAAAFARLPLNILPWHQLLLLYFHFFPMFVLQLLLCRQAKLGWRLLVPPVLLAVPGIVFLSIVGWAALGWLLFLWWCLAPALGCTLAWLVWAVGRLAGARKNRRKML